MLALAIFLVVLLASAKSSSIPGKKTVIITGANSGVGLAATKILASTNQWYIVMACRDKLKSEVARASITYGKENTEILPLDLADLESIKNFAELWGSRQFDVLACNAGLQESQSGFGGKEKGVVAKRTEQGYEMTVGVNHIGHFLLINLLKSKLKNDKGRIVIVGSGVHDPDSPGGNVGSKASLGSLDGLKAGFKDPISMVDGGDYDPDKAYKDSKLCNVMTSLELARRLRAENSGVVTNSMNPGLIPTTGLFREINPLFVFFFTLLTRYVFKVAVSEEEGGSNLAFMISNPTLDGITGGYFSAIPGVGGSGKSFGPIVASKEARDEDKARRLWALSEELVKDYL